MKSRITILFLLAVAFAGGLFTASWFSESGPDATSPGAAADAEPEILYWVAPMDPNYRRDGPGKSPMGMDLVPVYAGQEDSGDAVTIDPAVVNNLGVRTEKAQVRPLWRRIEATGYVGFDESRISDINLRVAGWIVRLEAEAEGERVKQGDLLFELYSPELVNAQKEYLQVVQRGDTRLLQGAGEKLRALGMNRSEIEALAKRGTASENIRILAPQDGVIAALNAREGMYVQPNTTIMRLADLSSVWLQAEVFESQAQWVAAGQAAEARLEYMPGAAFSGQVDYVYPVLDPVTRTLRVRLRFDNPDERLKPNMYARVSIFGRLKPNALSIPREALIRAPGRDRVVVALGEGRFRVSEVLSGLESGEYVEILAGLEEGEEVVTSAQFLIDSEASLAGSIQRLQDPDATPPEREPGPVYASGWVDEVDVADRHVRISHGPIEALGWPSMTMVFDALPGVDVRRLKPGQGIRFALEQAQAGEYVLARVFAEADDESDMSEVTADMLAAGKDSGKGAGQASTAKSETPRRIMAGAVIRGVMPEERKLRLQHDPIPELDWPAMTMNFSVDASVDISRLQEGQNIHFGMAKEGDRWVIDQVHVMQPVESEPEHDHD